MSYTLLDGKAFSQKLRNEVKKEVELIKKEFGTVPGLSVILVGENKASQVYVRNKEKACVEAGISSEVIKMAADTSEADLLKKIEELNNNKNVHGILVQLPLPKHINEDKVTFAILPEKDVDGFHPYNVGLLFSGKECIHRPCTPSGVIELLKEYNIDMNGKDAVVVGRSNIVGKPMGLMLLNENCTVTTCHSRTADLVAKCKSADILVAAIGRAQFITEDMVKDGAVIVDVGMNRDENNKLCGDVDFEKVAALSSAITPVPGGVGPLTIAMLLKNTVSGFKHYFAKES